MPLVSGLRSLALAGACGWAIAAAPAAASPLSTTDLLNQFNLVVFGDMVGGSDVQGRSLIGGNLSGNSMTFHTRPAQTPASGHPALTVGGNITGGFKNLNGGGSAVVGGNVQNMNLNGGGSLTAGGSVTGTVNGGPVAQNQAVSVPSFAAQLIASSAALAQLPGVAPGRSGNRGSFNGATPTDGRAVYTTDLAFFSTTNELQLGLNGAETVIINVGGLSGVLTDNFLGGPFAAAPNVVWNFYEATSLTFERQVFGTVLAPHAAVTLRSSIEGTLVADSLVQNAAVNLRPFAGSIPEPEATAVPAPAALPLFLVGLAGLTLAAARRRVG